MNNGYPGDIIDCAYNAGYGQGWNEALEAVIKQLHIISPDFVQYEQNSPMVTVKMVYLHDIERTINTLKK